MRSDLLCYLPFRLLSRNFKYKGALFYTFTCTFSDAKLQRKCSLFSSGLNNACRCPSHHQRALRKVYSITSEWWRNYCQKSKLSIFVKDFNFLHHKTVTVRSAKHRFDHNKLLWFLLRHFFHSVKSKFVHVSKEWSIRLTGNLTWGSHKDDKDHVVADCLQFLWTCKCFDFETFSTFQLKTLLFTDSQFNQLLVIIGVSC